MHGRPRNQKSVASKKPQEILQEVLIGGSLEHFRTESPVGVHVRLQWSLRGGLSQTVAARLGGGNQQFDDLPLGCSTSSGRKEEKRVFSNSTLFSQLSERVVVRKPTPSTYV